MNAIRRANATEPRPFGLPADGPAAHCRHALRHLEQLQARLLDDPRSLPLTHTLRLLGAAKDCVWRSVWLLERRLPRDTAP
jgi:hypothetical protein